jgi:hypothetical protein
LGACTDYPDGFAIELAVDFGVGKEAGLLPDFGRDRDLSL